MIIIRRYNGQNGFGEWMKITDSDVPPHIKMEIETEIWETDSDEGISEDNRWEWRRGKAITANNADVERWRIERRRKKCIRCNGTGKIVMVCKPPREKSEPDDQHEHVVECPQLGCHNGIWDREEYYRSWIL